MLYSTEEIKKFILENYPEIQPISQSDKNIIDYCPKCKARMGLKVLMQKFVAKKTDVPATPEVQVMDLPFFIYLFCPECESHQIWILYLIGKEKKVDKKNSVLIRRESTETKEYRVYRLLSIPGESQHDIPGLPAEPASLRKAYFEAIKCLDNNCPMAAAAMFRRALQVITRDILGAKLGTLADELIFLKNKSNNLGIKLTKDFHDNGYIIKETGNQAAHPDKNPDLLDFTPEDAENLHKLFLEIVTELFVVPDAAEKAREELFKRRKIRKQPE
ncbi:MAG: DUF4145 domain-containing protein [Candidatus Thorarchaeota archaeon]